MHRQWGRLWLIAEREFKAYVATASFWVALAVGPLMLALAVGLAALTAKPPAPPETFAVHAADPALAALARGALLETAALEARSLLPAAPGAPATVTITVARRTDGAVSTRVDGPFGAEGRALVAAMVERDVALGRKAPAPKPPAPPRAQASAGPGVDLAAIGRFGVVMTLWLTLTGSLGMLLQAVVRERSNRALESLLAAATPTEIVFGKLAGVGAVSLLVLGAWLGAGAALAPLVPRAGGLSGALLGALADPLQLLHAALVYVLGFVFYGLVTVAAGAAARDSAAAQNLSRPMFGVLLIAFFAALATAGGALHMDALVYVPPLTPFLLLLAAPGSITPLQELGALAGLAVSSLAAWRLAMLGLGLGPTATLKSLLPRKPATA